MEITAALALGRRLLREHGLDDWRVVADHAKTRAGACRFRTKTISLSRPLTALHDEELVRDTILHEIAHALVGPTHGHDRVWRATARQIGCTGERLVSADAPRVEGDWRGQCPAGHEITRHRRPQRVVSCSQCSPTFSPRHLIAWTYRGRPVAMGEAYQRELTALQRRHNLPAPSLPPPAATPSGSSSLSPSPGPPGPQAAVTRGARGGGVIQLGDHVLVVSGGRLHGRVGGVEAVHDTRCQVRVDADLYLIPHELLEVVDALAG